MNFNVFNSSKTKNEERRVNTYYSTFTAHHTLYYNQGPVSSLYK